MSVIDWAAQARRRCRLPKIFFARSYLRGNWVAEDIMATPEFKKMVVETMKKEHLSIYAAMQEVGINNHKII